MNGQGEKEVMQNQQIEIIIRDIQVIKILGLANNNFSL
jgi:hypothetical protein